MQRTIWRTAGKNNSARHTETLNQDYISISIKYKKPSKGTLIGPTMISVVIPLYNKAATIERAIRSVLNQTVGDLELIVVDNGSTDGSATVVKAIDDPRLRIVEQPRPGVSAARNRGIEAAGDEWVAFLDADDEWRPTFLETVWRLHSAFPTCAVCATAYQRCNHAGVIADISLRRCPEARDFLMENYFEVAACSDPPFCSISVMVRKDALLAIGGFPEGIHQGEDLLTWTRLASAYAIAYCREPQSIFYTGETSAMGKPKRIPAADDFVGRELEKICDAQPGLKGIRQYIAHWHKMRASIYLRLPGHSAHCRAEARLSRQWHRNPKLTLYTVLSIIPYPLRMKLLKIN